MTQKILSRKNILQATKYTYWSKDFPLNTIKDFDDYLNTPGVVQATTTWVTRKVRKFITSPLNRLIVSDERMFGSLDSCLDFPDCLPYFLSEFDYRGYDDGKEVYYFITSDTASDERINLALMDSGGVGPFSCAALIELPNKSEISPKSEVCENVLDVLAENVKHIVSTAFDMEGFIICSFDEKL